MENKKHSEKTKRKISETQKLRHAFYKQALKEAELSKLNLDKTMDKTSENEYIEQRTKIVSRILNLIDDIDNMIETKKSLSLGQRVKGDNDVKSELIGKTLHEEINNFIKNECEKNEESK